nr:unnamed protein product [Callosobruchus chinensis]
MVPPTLMVAVVAMVVCWRGAMPAAVDPQHQEDDALLREFTQGNRKFTAAVYRELLKQKRGNFIVSPFSVETILALTNEGAKGETSEELVKGLSLPEDRGRIRQAMKSLLPKLTASNEESQLLTANKIYADKSASLNAEFAEMAKDVYGSGIENLNFADNNAAANEINQWVEKHTDSKIKKLISSEDITEDMKLVLVNGLYFDGKWTKPFAVERTVRKPFFRLSNDSCDVDMMRQVEYFKYYENPELNAKFLELNYKGNNVSMVIVLPNEKEGLSALEENIDKLLEPQPYETQRVELSLPKFGMESKIQFVPILENLGVNKLFSDRAELKGFLSEQVVQLHVSLIVQKAFINVTETGTKAAAATGVELCPRACSSDEPGDYVFLADRPFLFFIKKCEVVLFAGKYCNV